MKQFPLTQGKFALVDDQDFELLNKFKWFARKGHYTFYSYTNLKINGKLMSVAMHRFLLNVYDKKILVDHINHNGLDNQRNNIRICTRSQNSMNQNPKAKSTSIYKGVSYRKDRKKWTAHMVINGKNIHIGTFINEVDAAKAYDSYAVLLHKEFARFNFK